ncbi:alpha-2,8-sialyltransferase 8E-like [Ptychodera flava]|uniref:alpha-2,8-sialyltransferase 8E-like n=1 Tax=Ptychodera flava TaxID=63121 RepID=UPI003969C048
MKTRSKITLLIVIFGLLSSIVTFSTIHDDVEPSEIEIREESVSSVPTSSGPEVHLFNSIKTNWTYNQEEANKLRSLLESECNTTNIFLTTQENVQLRERLHFEGQRRAFVYVFPNVFERFPKNMPFGMKSFKRCSLVGNSGILLGSQCGRSIDLADFVIRFNLASVQKFSEDVGSKTDLVTCNPSILIQKYDKLRGKWGERFKEYMVAEYSKSIVYIPAFSYYFCKDLAFAAQDALEPLNFTVGFPHPNLITLVTSFWKARNISEFRITSGLLLFSAAMSFCEEVHLYGYWPFLEDPDGNPIYYHYFDKHAVMLSPQQLKICHHDFPAEFTTLRDLHNKGVIRMHVGKCNLS